MKNNLFLLFSQYKQFWKTKTYISNKTFTIKAKVFNSRTKRIEQKKNYSYFQSILKLSQSSIFLAILLALLLQLTNTARAPFIQEMTLYFNKYILFLLTNEPF